MKITGLLPDAFLRCMSPEDRRALAVNQLTAEEALVRCRARSERELQGFIINLLRLRGIHPLWHRTDKKSAATLGWPDITFAFLVPEHFGFAVSRVIAVGWEVKLPGEKPTPGQIATHCAMVKNGWIIDVPTSVDMARELLKGYHIALW